MKLRTAASIALIIFAVGICFWMFVRPVIMPEKTARFVSEEQLYHIGNTEEGKRTFMYADFKDEVKEWSKILVGFAPLISVLLAYFLSRKKR